MISMMFFGSYSIGLNIIFEFLILIMIALLIWSIVAKKKKKKKKAGQDENVIQNKNAKQKTCPSCGAVVPEGAAFCGSCGKKFAKVCKNCGKELSDGETFCIYCGTIQE